MGGSIQTDPPSLTRDNDSFVNISALSDIVQIDGLYSCDSSSSDDGDTSDSNESNVTDYDTEDEIEPETGPINITPTTEPGRRQRRILQASSLPLVAVMNARSLYNKPESFKTFLKELGVEAAIVSETWEREEESLEELLQMSNYKVHSYKRPKVKAKKQPGGACAIVYNENRFKATKLDIAVPKGVEACWLLLKPLQKNDRKYCPGLHLCQPNFCL